MRIDFSKYESECLGVKLGRVTLSGLAGPELDAIRRSMSSERYDVVMIRDLAFDFRTASDLDWTGLTMVDVKIQLACPTRRSSPPAGDDYVFGRDVSSKDLANLREIGQEMATVSWFWADEQFGPDVAARFYATWLENSVQGLAADHCFVARNRAGGDAVAFATIQCHADAAEMVLAAVKAEHRGRGVGAALVEHVLGALQEMGIPRCRLKTQLTNATSQRFFGSLGFRFDRHLVDFKLRPRP